MPKKLLLWLLSIALVAVPGVATATMTPPTWDVNTPTPLRHQTNVTYKGLSLQLTTNKTPTVTPVQNKIGLVCIGMSNASMECEHFRQFVISARQAGQVNLQVVVVNCAVGSRAIEHWNDPTYDSELWLACLNQKVPAAGLTRDQVRVVWHKAASAFTMHNGQVRPPYPDPNADYFMFYQSLDRFAKRLTHFMPAVQAVYVTARSYGGFALNPARGEPLSFESGLALNQWLADNPQAGTAWYGWGPYIWAPDCTTGVTNDSGVCYERTDYLDDGVHPTPAGRAKVTAMLHTHFSRYAWYTPPTSYTVIGFKPTDWQTRRYAWYIPPTSYTPR